MDKTPVDWRFLASDLLWPGVSALVMLVVLAGTIWFHGEQRRAFADYSVNQDAMHENYDALVTRRRILERYHNRYDAYRSTGFVGQESRLEWADTVRDAVSQLDVPNVSYSVEPQREVVPPVTFRNADPDLKIYVSRIALEVGMVHELDFLRLFDALKGEVPGLMKVDRCKVSRLVDVASKTTIDANMTASCSMMLFSVITSDINQSGSGS
ncbi:MAG: hypothetical protein KJO31_00650 [Gammaproteobacteria bacterium]|nr:hypothetical protein [Gammaproteobacteria bacterium]